MTNSTLPPTLLAELVAAKFTHDVAGPVSAMANGVELMGENADDADMQREATELLRMSSTELKSRVQLYRQAYGVISGGGQCGVEEVEGTLKDYFQYLKTDCSLVAPTGGAAVTSLNFHGRRLLINGVLLVAGLLIGKATIRVSLYNKHDGIIDINVLGTALKSRQDEDVDAIFEERFDSTKLSVKNIQPYMTRQFAQELGAKVQVKVEGASVELKAQCPQKTIC